ncbi:MAG: DUF456 domain-containing protein [Armatimonadota bacterium]
MLTFLIVLGYIIFVLVLVAGVVAVMLSLPGTVLILLDAIVFAACTHWQRPSWWVLLIVAVLALVAETSDNVLSMLGTRHGGGSTKSGWIALLGGLAGALTGSLISPLFGSIGLLGGAVGFLLGVVLIPLSLAVAGGYCAVYWYELKQGRTRPEAQQSAKGALLGRLLGVMSKTLLAAIMSGLLLWAVFVPLLRH